MMMFHPAPRAEMGPRQLSAHELVNQAVAPLHVICTGQENGRLYFEKMEGASSDSQHLVNEIARVLMETPDLRERLAPINTISLKG